MSSWNCPHEERGRCNRVARAYCRPGMKGCVLVGKVTFQDGVVPEPVWPEGEGPRPGGRAGEREPG